MLSVTLSAIFLERDSIVVESTSDRLGNAIALSSCGFYPLHVKLTIMSTASFLGDRRTVVLLHSSAPFIRHAGLFPAYYALSHASSRAALRLVAAILSPPALDVWGTDPLAAFARASAAVLLVVFWRLVRINCKSGLDASAR